MYLLLYLAFILFLRQVHAAEPTIEQFISYSRSSEDNVASSADPEWHNLVNNADSEHTSPPQPIIEEVPGVYIVELEKDASLLRRAEGQDSHTLFHREAQEQLTYSTRYEFKNEDSFYGLSLSLKNIEDLGKLKNLPQVRRIWPVESIPRPLSRYGSTAAPLRPRSKFQRRQSNGTLVFPEVNGPPIDSTIRMAGVDKLHEAGIKGKGMKIAVIDTGIDYHHPALGRGFGPGKKVSFGYAFVGDDYTGRPGSPRLPSDDPLTTCGEGGHGTHVAGIIGAEDRLGGVFGLEGVAPEAEIGMYRVFGCSGGLETDLLVAAMDRASGSGADVVSISIGAAYQFWGGEDGNPYAQIASAIESKNIALVIASGNNGSLGPWRPTQPGTGAGSIAAGSIANTIFPTIYTGTDSRNASFQYSSVWPLQIPDGLNLVVAGQNASATDLESRYGCSQVTYNQIATTIQDQNQTIVAVRKGGCWSGIKWLWAEEFGFKYLLEYMPEDEMSLDVYDREIYSDVPMKDFTGITVTADTSDTILQGALADANYRVYFGNGTYTSIKSLIGGLMSNYSSVGPTAEGDMKPQLSAPGGNILSTWPLEGGGYAIISGTSMATPFLAGCFALAKSLYPEAKVRDLKALLQSTSKQIPWAYDENIVVSVASQGAGAVQIDRVQQPSATFNVGEFNLHSVEELQPQELTIRNPTTQSVTYSISHQGAGLVTFRPNLNTTQATGQYFGIQTNPTVNLPFYATSSPNSNSITLEPGTSTTITITFSPPNSGISDLQLPVYSGFIDITTDAEEKYSIPYLGIDYDRAAANPIYIGTASNTVLPVLSDTSTPLTTYKTFTLNSSLHPSILFINSQPTKGIRVELVPANTSFIPDFWYNGHVTPDFPLNGTYLPSALETKTFAGAETFGLLFVNGTTSPSFKTVELTGTSKVMTDVEVKDTTEVIERKDVPDGDYRMLLRVLKWNGNRTSKEGWESWMSAAFGIRKGG